MNITFYLMVFLIAGAAWFLLSFCFPLIGKLFRSIFRETKNYIEKDDENKENK